MSGVFRGRSGWAVICSVFLSLASLPALAQDQESIIAYVNPDGTVGNQDFGGSLGMDFDVNLDILITHLGVFDSGSDGLNLPITARLYEREFQEELAVLEFTPDDQGELIGGSRFKELEEPIELTAGERMTIVAEGYGAGESNGNQGAVNLGLSTDAGPCSISFVGGGRYGDPGLFPATVDGGPVNRYAAGTFMFTPLEELDEAQGGIAYIVPEFTFGNQSFSGPLGMDFNVLKNIQVTRLGVFDSGSDGLFLPITARLYDRNSQEPLATLEFTPDEPGEPEDGSTFKDLDPPLPLAAGFQGSIVAVGYGDLEQNGNQGVGPLDGLETDSGGCAIEFVGTSRYGDAGNPDAFPQTPDGGPSNQYAAGTFEFEPFEGELATPLPPTDVTATPGDGEIVLSWTAPVGGAEIVGYYVLQTLPAPPVRVNADLIAGTTFTVTGLCGGVEHCFTVSSVDMAGVSSEPSEEVCATPAAGDIPDDSFVAYHVPEGTAGNQAFTGALGMDFIVNTPIVVTELGVFDDLSDGLNSPLTARLYNTTTEEELASLEFTPDDPGEPVEGSLFKELDAPVPLPAGFEGTIVGVGYGAGENNGNQGAVDLGLFTDDGACQLSFVGGGRYGNAATPDIFPNVVDGGPVNRYGAGTFVFSKLGDVEIPEPPLSVTATIVGGDRVQLNWEPPPGGPAVTGYNVYRTSPPPTGRLNADLVTGTSFTSGSFANGVNVCFAVRSVSVGGFESVNSNEPCVEFPAPPQPPGSIVAYEVPKGTIGNQNFEGPLGLDFDVDLDVLVTHLGVFDSSADGLQRTIIATLYDRTTEEVLASLEFTPDDPGDLIGGSRFRKLEEPVDLGGGTMCTIVAEGYGAGEPNGNTGTPSWTTNRGPCSLSFVGVGRYSDVPGEFPLQEDAGPENRYAAGTFLFEPLEVLEDTRGGIAYQVPESTVGNQNFGGSLGMDFDVQVDILVTRIGVFDSGSDGLFVPITAQLFDRDTQEELVRVEFTPDDSGDPEDGSTFKDLDPPLLLRSGFHGTVSAAGYGDLEPNGNQGVGPLDGLTTDDGGCAINFVGGGRYGDAAAPGSFPGTVDGGPANRYAAGTFEFEPALAPETVFHRGDPNDDGVVNLTDAVAILDFLFGGGAAPQCAETADVDNDASVNITDAVSLLEFLFGGEGVPPALPGPPTEPCGPDPDEPGSAGDLGCEVYTSC